MKVKCNPGEAVAIAILVAALILVVCWEVARGGELQDMVRVAAVKHDVPYYLLEAVIFCESGWETNAVGDDGKSRGLFQINVDVHNVDKTKIFDPSYNIEFGTKFLKELLTRFSPDTLRALTAWNFGVSKTLRYNLYVGNHALKVWLRYERSKEDGR